MKKDVFRFIIFVVSLPIICFAQYSGDINLNNAHVVFVGEDTSDYAGYHMAIAGDVNNDNFDDILIAAPMSSEGGDNAGQVYLILGKQTTNWETTINLSDADASFWGEERGNEASHDVFGLGDINNDGYDDFAIGVKKYPQPTSAGKVYIFFGSSDGWEKDTPISEAAIAGCAVGSAAGGLRPVLEIMYIDFISIAMDQIINHGARWHQLSTGKINFPMVVRTQGGVGFRNSII